MEAIPYIEYQQILKELDEKLSGNIYYQNRNAKLPFESFGASMDGEQMYIFFVYAHFLSDSLLLKAIKAYGDLLQGNESSMNTYLFPDIINIYDNFKYHNYNIRESPLSESEREHIENYKKDNIDDIVFFLPKGITLMPEDPKLMFVEELKEHNRSRIQEYNKLVQAKEVLEKPDKFESYHRYRRLMVNPNDIIVAMINAGETKEFIDEWKSLVGSPPEGWLKDGGNLKSFKHPKKSKNKSKKQKKDGSRRNQKKSGSKKKRKSLKKY